MATVFFAGQNAMWRKGIIAISWFVGLTTWFEPIAAQTPSPVIEQLADQLGAESFAGRQAAAAALVRIGSASKEVLRRRMRDPSLEVRLAAEGVLQQILQHEFDERLHAFVTGAREVDRRWLPCWDRVQQLTGDEHAARRMYARMLRSEGSLLLACAQDAEDFPEQLSERVQDLQPFNESGEYAPRRVEAATIATLLVVGEQALSHNHHGGLSELVTLLTLAETIEEMLAAQHVTIVRPLLAQFVLALADSKWTSGRLDSGRYYALELALTYNLEATAAALSRRILLWPNSPPMMLQHALLGLGRCGDDGDIDLLRPHLKNRMLCHTPSLLPDSQRGSVQVQVRDIALAVEIHLLRRQPRDYGFLRIEANQKTLFVPQSCGFISAAARKAAFAAWEHSRTRFTSSRRGRVDARGLP